MMHNISNKSLFGWPLWRFIEKQRLALPTHQMERWHLRDLHDKRKVIYLTRWLASHVRHSTKDAIVSVRSTWIDHYPQAHSYFLPSTGGSPLAVSVELADLLLVVELRDKSGNITSKRAALVQAKCSDDTTILDKESAGSSTQDERHLLEANCAPIKVTGLAGSNSPPINATKPNYDLGASATAPGLKEFARYLLIPRKEFPKEFPYMTVWPPTLAVRSGCPVHFSKVMLAMVGLGSPGAFSGAAVTGAAVVPDWANLVKDLTSYCASQPLLNRFFPKTKAKIPRHVEWEYDVGVFQQFRAFFVGLLRSAFDRNWLNAPLQLNMMPKGRHSRSPPDEALQSDAPVEGFTILKLTITTSEPIFRREKIG